MKNIFFVIIAYFSIFNVYANVSNTFNQMYYISLSNDLEQKQQVEQIQAIYQKELESVIAKKQFNALTEIELRELLRAADMINFYVPHDNYIGAMNTILDELIQRNIAKSIDYQIYYSSLISARNFKKAKEFAQKYPQINLEELPVIQFQQNFDQNQPAILKLQDDKTLLIENIKFNASKQIVVVVGTKCTPSNRARDMLLKQEKFKQLLAHHAIWLTPQTGSLGVASIQHWNNIANSQTPLAIIYDQSKFSQFDTWSMPTFYFLRDGKVVYQFSGWSEQGNWPELEKGLQKLGIAGK